MSPVRKFAAFAALTYMVATWATVTVAAETSFIVFFPKDKAVLGPAAAEVVGMVADQATGSSDKICVVGHTDTAESAPDKLSADRAQAVVDELMKRGIAKTRIDAEGVGAREPMVETGPNTSEPQNRRATIDIGCK